MGQPFKKRYQGARKAGRNSVEIVGLQKLQIQSASLVAIGANPLDIRKKGPDVDMYTFACSHAHFACRHAKFAFLHVNTVAKFFFMLTCMFTCQHAIFIDMHVAIKCMLTWNWIYVDMELDAC